MSGGTMFYPRHGLDERGWPRLGDALGGFYAIGVMVGCLGPGQPGQRAAAGRHRRVEPAEGHGLVLAVTVGAVILGGIRSIAAVTARLVPFMAGLYFVSTIAVLVPSLGALPQAIANVFVQAFAPEAVAGGAIGALVVGMKRGVFSNEAGIGSASIAHSAAKTRLACPAWR